MFEIDAEVIWPMGLVACGILAGILKEFFTSDKVQPHDPIGIS